MKADRNDRDGARYEADQAIVESVNTLGRRLGLVVVAEGVETDDQEAARRKLGVPMGQGFRYGRPAPAEEVLG